MARILKKKRMSLYVWKNMHLNRSRAILFSTLLILAFMLFIMNKFPFASIGIILIPISYVLGIYAYKTYLTWRGGVEGERVVASALNALDDSYILINDVVIPPNRGDTDHILVGMNGIFVVETKNYGGRVSCVGDDWKRSKTGRGGGTYRLTTGSPSKQVKRNAKVLKDFILERQEEVFNHKAPHLWIHSILVFTNKNAVLKIDKPTVNVLELEELADFISNTVSETPFTPQMVDAIGGAILKYSR